VRLFSFLIPKDELAVQIDFGDRELTFARPVTETFADGMIQRPASPAAPANDGEMVDVPLIDLAWGRSGDKGNKANVGIIARQADYLPYIWAALSENTVSGRFSHFLEGETERFLMPGSNAINFLMDDVLGGGGVASLRSDAQGKGYAQILLTEPISIPKAMAEKL